MTLSAGYDCFRNGLSGRVDGLGGQNKQMDGSWMGAFCEDLPWRIPGGGGTRLALRARPAAVNTHDGTRACESILLSSLPRNVQNRTKYRVTVLGAPRHGAMQIDTIIDVFELPLWHV